MNEVELIAALTPLVCALGGLIFKMLREKDTNKHGDAFIGMLRSGADIARSVANIYPSVKSLVDDYEDVVDTAEEIWESSGFTATDISILKSEAKSIKRAIEAELAKFRRLRS